MPALEAGAARISPGPRDSPRGHPRRRPDQFESPATWG